MGETTAIRGENVPVFIDSMYIHAPNGTLFDLTGEITDETLITQSAFSDAAGLGNISSLGTFDGFRVPTIKGCNFEDFDGGLTFTGTCDKIFIRGSPFRGVTASNVTILELASGLDVDLVDLPNNYVKDVQTDTEVLRVDASATISDQLQYRGTIHDTGVTEDNILVGDADRLKEPYWVSDAYPLPDTKAFASYDSTETGATTTISQQASSKTDEGAYVPVDVVTTMRASARFSEVSDNLVSYDGSRDVNVELDADIAAGTGAEETLAVAFFRDGSLVEGSAVRFISQDIPGAQGISGTGVSTAIVTDVANATEFDIRVANLGSTNDVTVDELDVQIVV
jgi:hypothetical protein